MPSHSPHQDGRCYPVVSRGEKCVQVTEGSLRHSAETQSEGPPIHFLWRDLAKLRICCHDCDQSRIHLEEVPATDIKEYVGIQACHS
jgi:hypothetical protein